MDRMIPVKPKILVTRALPGGAVERLRRAGDVTVFEGDLPIPREVLIERIGGVDGLLSLLTDRVDEAVLEAAGPTLKVVSNYAVGFDNIDVAAATKRRIPVGNTPGVLTETTADLAFALLMAGARRIEEGAALCRQKAFVAWSPTLLLGWDVHGATLGILGMGRIGRAVARRARGFGMKVIFTGGSGEAPEGALRVGLDTLLEQSDFLSLHAPLNDGTRHLIDRRAFERMKPSAVLVNTARGPVIDHDAMVEALSAGRIAGAALDVTDPEPLPDDHPLLALDNCLIVPHLGSGSHATRAKMADMAADNLIAGLRGDRLPHCVNPAVYGP
jgi:glyoxylate reductase